MSFSSKYRPDHTDVIATNDVSVLSRLEPLATGVTGFLGQHQGRSFNRGLYRVHLTKDIPHWTNIVADAFPAFRDRVFCFSCDWLGRHFAIDSQRRETGECQVLMLEPGTGQALEIPASFMTFHDVELVEYQNEALAADFYQAWLSAGGAVPDRSQCVGYKKPLILGGKDEIQNLELIDMEVYWSISGQLLAKVRDLPSGRRIGNVSIS